MPLHQDLSSSPLPSASTDDGSSHIQTRASNRAQQLRHRYLYRLSDTMFASDVLYRSEIVVRAVPLNLKLREDEVCVTVFAIDANLVCVAGCIGS